MFGSPTDRTHDQDLVCASFQARGAVVDVEPIPLVVGLVPLLLLVGLVLRSRPLTPSAWTSVAVGGLLGIVLLGLSPQELLVGVLRGVWTGGWILAIVLPALLLFGVLDTSGALDHLADAADQLAPTPGRRLALLAWVLPSFLQGAAGFGTPIAMTAPMLVRGGMAPAAAVGACLIGYQWAVTFGSMGSSYFMASATARLGDAASSSFALRAGLLLGVTAIVSGLLVLRRAEERRAADLWRVLLIGVVMAGTLVGVVRIEPALGSTAAGLAGLAAAWIVLPERGSTRPGGADVVVAALPYVALSAAVTIAFGVPAVRDVLARVPEIAPVLPGSDASYGFSTRDAPVSPAFRPLLHPLPYLLLAVVVAVVGAKRRGWWSAQATTTVLTRWRSQVRKVSGSIIGLTTLAAVMVEAGMIAAVAVALAGGLGLAFVGVSPLLGTFGTALTGSTTASNALFSSLQARVAGELSLPEPVLLSGQTSGGNVGNAISPVNVAVGASAVDVSGAEGDIVRANLRDAAVLLGVVIAGVVLQVVLLP